MIIEIESIYGDTLLHGKRLEKAELIKAVKELLASGGERDFVSAFCARYGYEAIPYDERLIPCYTIDTDTHLVTQTKD